MKRISAILLSAALLISLAACKKGESPNTSQPKTTEAGAETAKEKTVSGVINRLGNFMVLLTDDGEYQTFDFDKELDPSSFSEGDRVQVTYTGVMGDESSTPVAVVIMKE